jgi:hypothetical protein
MPRRPATHATSFTLAKDDDTYRLSVSGDPGNSSRVVAIDAGLVDLEVLRKSRFEIAMRADGTLTLDAMGLPEAVIAKAQAAKLLPETDLVSLVKACLDPRLMALEDDPAAALAQLKARLQTALGLVEDAAKRL